MDAFRDIQTKFLPLPQPFLHRDACYNIEQYASYDYTSKMKEDGESISWGDYADYMEVDYNHFDAGMNIGVGVWYDRFNLDLTYQRGFIDAFSDADGFKTSNFMIRLGIAF